MALFPVVEAPSCVIVSQMSRQGMGREIDASGIAAPGTGLTNNTNQANLYPFWLPEPAIALKLFVGVDTTGTGNVDAGIYSPDGTRIVSGGSTAHGTTQKLLEFDITDTILGRGNYYMAMASSNNTDTFLGWFDSTNIPILAPVAGMAQVASAFALPATLTPAKFTGSSILLMGLALRTLVN